MRWQGRLSERGEFACFAEDIAVRAGRRRSDGSEGNRKIVTRAGAELEAAGVIARVRKDGRKSPWVWRFLELEESAGSGAPRWSVAETAVDRLVARSPLGKLGPVAVDVYAHAAALADAHGHFSLLYQELRESFGGRDAKTVIRHLRRLAGDGIGVASLTEECGAKMRVAVTLCLPPELTREEERELVARISAAHERTKARRHRAPSAAKGEPGTASASTGIDEETSAVWERLPDRVGAGGQSSLRELVAAIVRRTEQEQRTLILGELLEQTFVAPVLDARRTYGEQVVGRVLERIAATAAHAGTTERVMPERFAPYLRTACRREQEGERLQERRQGSGHRRSATRPLKRYRRMSDAEWVAAMRAIMEAGS